VIRYVLDGNVTTRNMGAVLVSPSVAPREDTGLSMQLDEASWTGLGSLKRVDVNNVSLGEFETQYLFPAVKELVRLKRYQEAVACLHYTLNTYNGGDADRLNRFITRIEALEARD